MSDEKNETVADIMTEMRTYADSMEKHHLYDLRECGTDYLRVLADRIETAVMYQFREVAKMIPHEEVAVSKMETTTPTSEKSSQVWNAAEMREALSMIVDACDSFHQFVENGLDGHYEAIPNYDGGVDDFLRCVDTAKAALSAPPRNCDRPECTTTKEAQDTWRKEDGGQTAYYEWLFAEAKGYEKMSEKAGGIE